MIVFIITLTILLFSVIIHEVAHGYMAYVLGDPTAKLQGRLTLNPIKHIDPVGSIIVPILTSFAGFTFGWAKPVEYNPYNLKNKRKGELLIALAGPGSNLIIAIIFSFILRIIVPNLDESNTYISIFSYIIVINLVLAVFNLIPLPPLDGSKILFSIFPNQYGKARQFLELYSPIFIFLVVFVLWKFISPIVFIIFKLLVGFN
jgi:Zn-dependent protease